MQRESIPGYRYGDPSLPRASVTLADFERMKKTALFGEEDAKALRSALPAIEPRVEAILDVWYGFVGSQPHLLAAFRRPGGEPDTAYLGAVRRRFAQWILDTLRAEYDQPWLDYQLEIGRRHHRIGKNKADGVNAAAHIPLSDILPLVYPIFATMRPFFEESGMPADRIDAIHHAWLKSLLLQVSLWSVPYVQPGDF